MYRAIVHATTGASLFKMLISRGMRVTSRIFPLSTEVVVSNFPEYVLHLKYYTKHDRSNVYKERD